MYLFIMRHGEAASDATCDSERPLTPAGRQHAHKAAVWLAHQSVQIEQILVSPYLRTRQTLLAVREVLPLPQEEVMPAITPDGDSEEVSQYLKQLAAQSCAAVLLISHLPFIASLVTELCPQAVIPAFSTSGIAHIKLNATGGEPARLLEYLSLAQMN